MTKVVRQVIDRLASQVREGTLCRKKYLEQAKFMGVAVSMALAALSGSPAEATTSSPPPASVVVETPPPTVPDPSLFILIWI